ncbi:uncharacterized protein PG986_002487 [Apiospora aurea]|uniref:Uncharacterized protein n=1 Tax=Apiospora aurea TaxID=335848 RepID=A0ABR1QPS3_9PEZI
MASSPPPGEKRKAEEISSDAPLDNIINIDPDGDLVLVVGANHVGSSKSMYCVEKPVAFRIDYKALARASSPFKSSFDIKSDTYKPGTSEVGWTEHMPNCSPTGLKFLFLIAHAELSQLPRETGSPGNLRDRHDGYEIEGAALTEGQGQRLVLWWWSPCSISTRDPIHNEREDPRTDSFCWN